MPSRPLTLLACGLIALAASAQPYRFGCHHFRNGGHHAYQPTNIGAREDIVSTIARSDTFDLLHYDIAIDVTDYGGQTIKAATTITHVALISGADLRLDLVDGLIVDSITSPGGSLPYTHMDDLLEVDLPITLAGDTGELTVHYHGQPERDPDWGGFYFASNYIYNLGIGLSTIPPHFGKVWYPCFDSFVERASYTYHVMSSGTFRAHCQGDLISEIQLGGDTVVRTFDLDQEISTHVSAIAVANYVDSNFIHTGAYGDIPVRLTAKPAQLNNMVSKFVSLGEAIDCYEFWYGPYPYDRVGYVLTTDGALEIPENVAYPAFMADPGVSLFDNRGLFGHELGHHWWGDHVTPYTHNDMWIKEGPAEYSGHLLEEWAFGAEDFVDVVKDNMLYVLENAHLQDDGFQALSPMPDPQIYGLHTYYKGAAVIHNLRGYLGDTLFRQAMHTVQIDHGNATLDANGLRDALEAASGVQLDDFFNDQVFTPGYSVFTTQSMTSVPDGGGFLVDLVLRQRVRGTSGLHTNVPLDLTLFSADGQVQDYQVSGSGPNTALQVFCPFEPVMAALNRYNRLNQARMDHEFNIIPGEGFQTNVPRCKFLIYQNELVDTTLVRVEHIWAGAGDDPLAPGIYEVSNVHYWRVDGLWPEGTKLDGRLYYDGDPDELDEELYGISEADALLAYRPQPDAPWSICPDVSLGLGNLTDGDGFMTIDTLRQGEYAFAKGNLFIGMQEQGHGTVTLSVSPNPANDAIIVRGYVNGAGILLFDIAGEDGRPVRRVTVSANGNFEKRIDVEELPAGAYVLNLGDPRTGRVGSARFVIAR